MSTDHQPHFMYLNRDNRWLDFQWQGLALKSDGQLQLFSLPKLEGELPTALSYSSAPDGPAGLAIAPNGTLYFSDPASHQIFKIGIGDDSPSPLPCLGPASDSLIRLNTPRGLYFHPTRQHLLVADSGHHRIQIIDPTTVQVLGSWGTSWVDESLQPSAEVGRLNTPMAIAGDEAGNVYVVDYGNQRVQKFDVWGEVIPEFWQAIEAASVLLRPGDVAVQSYGDEAEVFILDRDQRAIAVFDSNGHFLRQIDAANLHQPQGIAIAEGLLYVGDNQQQRVLQLTTDGAVVGAAQGYRGSVAALLATSQHLWLHPGSPHQPLRLLRSKAFVNHGTLRGGPFTYRNQAVLWHRIKATVDLPGDSHIQLWFKVTDSDDDCPNLPGVLAPTSSPDEWQPMPMDGSDGLILKSGTYLWLGVHFISEGTSSPSLTQLYVQFNHDSYAQHLPPIYRREPHRETLERLVSLFESVMNDVEANIQGVKRYFDPQAVPAEWLPWLASWLAVSLDENWPIDQQRRAIAQAYRLQANRGTALGLQKALQFYAGVDAHIAEPILQADWWTLPDSTAEGQGALLGFTTRLAPSDPQGAVLGSTAVLDRAHLSTQDEFGVALFEDVAHQFTVQLYRDQVQTEADLARIQQVIEREKPAYTTYQICLIEPKMRIGLQSTIGIDTIVAGPPSPTPINAPTPSEWILGDGMQGRSGVPFHLGQTRLE